VGQTLGFGGFSVASGAYGIYGGLQDPNATMSALKVGVGATQVVGGMSYMAGHAMDSLGAVRFGSKAVSVANWATAPITLIDFYRGMQRKFEPGNVPLKGEEAVYAGVNDTLTLAGIFFPQAAIGAIVLKVAVEPAASEATKVPCPRLSRTRGERVSTLHVSGDLSARSGARRSAPLSMTATVTSLEARRAQSGTAAMFAASHCHSHATPGRKVSASAGSSTTWAWRSTGRVPRRCVDSTTTLCSAGRRRTIRAPDLSSECSCVADR